MKVLVTGANGFIGKALCKKLLQQGWSVKGAVRSSKAAENLIPETEPAIVGEIGPDTDWAKALHGIDVAVHLAARVHVLAEAGTGYLKRYRTVNTAGTEKLARSAAGLKIKRLVYLSTIKVNGESSRNRPFAAEDEARPEDPYAFSKWEAEQCLKRVSKETGLEHIVVRPPLVYGPGVKANFLRLIEWVDRGIPLPFASLRNSRSLVGLSNLTDLLSVCLAHPDAAGRVFFVSDGNDVSTPELIGLIASSLGKRPRLFSCPQILLRSAAALTRKKGEYERLTGSLRIDISAAKNVLGWEPRVSLSDGIDETVRWYRSL